MDPYRAPAEVKDLPKTRAPREVCLEQLWEWRKDRQTRSFIVRDYAFNCVNCWGITWRDNGKQRWVSPEFFDDCVLLQASVPYRENAALEEKPSRRLTGIEHFNATLRGAAIFSAIGVILWILTGGVYHVGKWLWDNVYHGRPEWTSPDVYPVEMWLVGAGTVLFPFLIYGVVRAFHYVGLSNEERERIG